MGSRTFALASLTAVVAQQPGTQKEEFHPSFPLQVCTNEGGCAAVRTSAVLDANMLWLDSVYPEGATGAGAERGPCATDSGKPDEVEEKFADSYVSFMNIKFGP